MTTHLRSLPSAFWGLAAALVLLLGAGLWFAGQSISVARQEVEIRKATVAAMSLADLVGATAAAGEPTPERLAAMIGVWRSGDMGILEARIVRRADGVLLATTSEADVQAGAVPRRLVRSEKRLFDLANGLRGNLESNAAEELDRLPEIDVAGAGPARLAVTAPVVVGDAVWGVVQVERERMAPVASAGTLLALLTGAVAIALMAGAAIATRRALPPGGTVGRWVLFLIAGVLLTASWYGFDRLERATIADARTMQVEEVRDLTVSLTDSARRVSAIAGSSLSGRPWDVDIYRRAFNQVSADGVIDTAAVAASAGQLQQSLSAQLRITFGLSLVLLAFVALGGARSLASTVREHRTAYGYVMPAMLGMLVLVFFPFTYGLILSFTDRTLVNQSVPLTDLWVGFANYVRILADVDVLRWTPDGVAINYESFYWTLFITVCWTVANVAIGVTLGMILALALNTEGLRGKTIYRVLLILPWAIPNYITALTWKGMFHPQFGVINQVIVMFGGEPVQWFDGVFTSFMTGVVANGWLSFPFMMVIILGALAAIPQDMYEAAKLDGASRWQQFWRITLPLLKPALIPAVILSVVWTFNMFNVIYLVSGGEPGGANEILITKAYKLAFERYQYAYAAAYSMVIFLILLAYGVFQNRATKATEAVA